MANLWLGLFGTDSIEMSVKGGKPKKAFNVLSIVMARDHTEIPREDLEFNLGTEIGSTMVDPTKDKPTKIVSLLGLVTSDDYYFFAWADKKPSKKRGTDNNFMSIKREGTSWFVCSRRPPYQTLVEFKTVDGMAQGVMNGMKVWP